jgi:hypothetical protein
MWCDGTFFGFGDEPEGDFFLLLYTAKLDDWRRPVVMLLGWPVAGDAHMALVPCGSTGTSGWSMVWINPWNFRTVLVNIRPQLFTYLHVGSIIYLFACRIKIEMKWFFSTSNCKILYLTILRVSQAALTSNQLGEALWQWGLLQELVPSQTLNLMRHFLPWELLSCHEQHSYLFASTVKFCTLFTSPSCLLSPLTLPYPPLCMLTRFCCGKFKAHQQAAR